MRAGRQYHYQGTLSSYRLHWQNRTGTKRRSRFRAIGAGTLKLCATLGPAKRLGGVYEFQAFGGSEREKLEPSGRHLATTFCCASFGMLEQSDDSAVTGHSRNKAPLVVTSTQVRSGSLPGTRVTCSPCHRWCCLQHPCRCPLDLCLIFLST